MLREIIMSSPFLRATDRLWMTPYCCNQSLNQTLLNFNLFDSNQIFAKRISF